jgi:hypothetical protein
MSIDIRRIHGIFRRACWLISVCCIIHVCRIKMGKDFVALRGSYEPANPWQFSMRGDACCGLC